MHFFFNLSFGNDILNDFCRINNYKRTGRDKRKIVRYKKIHNVRKVDDLVIVQVGRELRPRVTMYP